MTQERNLCMARAAILVSGGGRRLRCLLDCAFFNEIEGLELAGVISADPAAFALQSARSATVPAYVVDDHLFPNAGSYGLALLNKLKDIDTDFVVLAGFAPSLGPAARYYSGKVLGVFPALVPAFETLTEDDVCAAVLARGVQLTGATAYLADDEGRIGQILAQKAVPVQPDDTPATLQDRIFDQAQKELLIAAVRDFCAAH